MRHEDVMTTSEQFWNIDDVNDEKQVLVLCDCDEAEELAVRFDKWTDEPCHVMRDNDGRHEDAYEL